MTGEPSELKGWIQDCLARAVDAGRLTAWPVRALVYTAQHCSVVQFGENDSRVLFNSSSPGKAWQSPVYLVFVDGAGNVAAVAPEVATAFVPPAVGVQ